jgi:hypothetical protein
MLEMFAELVRPAKPIACYFARTPEDEWSVYLRNPNLIIPHLPAYLELTHKLVQPEDKAASLQALDLVPINSDAALPKSQAAYLRLATHPHSHPDLQYQAYSALHELCQKQQPVDDTQLPHLLALLKQDSLELVYAASDTAKTWCEAVDGDASLTRRLNVLPYIMLDHDQMADFMEPTCYLLRAAKADNMELATKVSTTLDNLTTSTEHTAIKQGLLYSFCQALFMDDTSMMHIRGLTKPGLNQELVDTASAALITAASEEEMLGSALKYLYAVPPTTVLALRTESAEKMVALLPSLTADQQAPVLNAIATIGIGTPHEIKAAQQLATYLTTQTDNVRILYTAGIKEGSEASRIITAALAPKSKPAKAPSLT